MVANVTGLAGPQTVAFSPDGAVAYVTASNANIVAVVNTSTYRIEGMVPVGMFPVVVALTPDGAFAYVTNNSSGTVSVIDTSDDMLVATVPVASPIVAASTPDGAFVYVTSLAAPANVPVIDTSSNTVVANVPMGSIPFGIAITPLPSSSPLRQRQ